MKKSITTKYFHPFTTFGIQIFYYRDINRDLQSIGFPEFKPTSPDLVVYYEEITSHQV